MKAVTFAFHKIKRLVFITEVERVYCSVRTDFSDKLLGMRKLTVQTLLNLIELNDAELILLKHK